jgi:hypothetical protein
MGFFGGVASADWFENAHFSIINTALNPTVTASATVNNRITFNKFGNYANNTGIYANITGTNVDLPSQTATAVGSGSAIFDRTFSGTGSKNSAGFVLNYTETGNGASASGIMTFVK